MRFPLQNSTVLFVAGTILGIGISQYWPKETVSASVANGNDKFNMVTVPLVIGQSEAVFVLNNLTGVLSGAALNNTTGTFTHHYLRSVAEDFATAGNTPEPKYAIVSAPASLQSQGASQPANGIIYIGELSSGRVIAYSFALPRGRGAPGFLEVVPRDTFLFSETVRN